MSCKILGFPDFPRVNFSAPNFSCGAGLKVICLFGLVFKFWNTGERNSGFFSFPRLQETSFQSYLRFASSISILLFRTRDLPPVHRSGRPRAPGPDVREQRGQHLGRRRGSR